MAKLKKDMNTGMVQIMKNVETMKWFDPMTWPEGITELDFIKKVLDDCGALIKNLDSFYQDNRRFQRLYQYRYVRDSNKDKSVDETFDVIQNNLLTFNIVRSLCNTAQNKIAKITPKVTLLTKDATTKEVETAKLLDKWIFKHFKKTHIYKEASMAFLEACVCGLGVLKLYNNKEKGVYYKKIPSCDFFFDNAYGGGHLPKVAGERKYFSAYELKKMYPEKEKEIELAHGDHDSVMVYEVYYKKKRHAIFSEKVLFLQENWEHGLPYELIKWSEATDGVVGVGLTKEVYYIQQTITYVLARILRCVHTIAVPKVLLAKGSDPTSKDWNNLVAEIVEYNVLEGDPKIITPPVIHPQVFEFLVSLWEKGFEVAGLSRMQAYGQLPEGLRQASGTALRSYNQMESERFQIVRQDYEQMFVRLAKKTIEFSKNGKLPKGVDYKEVEDAMENMSIFSSNILPETPAGRFAFVSDLLNSQMITSEQALVLLNAPDIDKLLTSEASRVQAIELELERAVKSGKKPDSSVAAVLGMEMYLDKARKMYAEILVEEGSASKKIRPLSSVILEIQQKLMRQIQAQQMAAQGNQGNSEPAPEPLSIGTP